jgi:hypothetical protein
MNNTTGKRLLHGICGAIIGALGGIYIALETFETKSELVLPALGGAIILGLLAFFFTDYFWEEFIHRG